MKTERLVAKPDQMIGGRGKAGLIAVNKSFDEVKAGEGSLRSAFSLMMYSMYSMYSKFSSLLVAKLVDLEVDEWSNEAEYIKTIRVACGTLLPHTSRTLLPYGPYCHVSFLQMIQMSIWRSCKTGPEAWISERMCKDTTVAGITGQLTHFLIEPFVPHQQSEEFYVCIQSHRYKDEIFFYHEGGVDVGDVDSKASKLAIPTGCDISEEMVRLELLSEVDASKQKTLASFIKALFTFYKELHFAYLEINPIAMLPNNKARTGIHHFLTFPLRAACRLCPWISLQRLTKQLHSCLDPKSDQSCFEI